jgi:hypothetical protein
LCCRVHTHTLHEDASTRCIVIGWPKFGWLIVWTGSVDVRVQLLCEVDAAVICCPYIWCVIRQLAVVVGLCRSVQRMLYYALVLVGSQLVLLRIQNGTEFNCRYTYISPHTQRSSNDRLTIDWLPTRPNEPPITGYYILNNFQ